MTRARRYILIAAIGSALLIAVAFFFQHFLELPPCKLCIWQRYPHVIAISIGLLAFAVPIKIFCLSGMLSTLSTAIIGIWHTGIERGLWSGPSSCSPGSINEISGLDLYDAIMNAPFVRCDVVAWDFLGLSMATWNSAFSIFLMAMWFMALRNLGNLPKGD
ncbi:MAG: disulfide bond formation protein B [Roseovarius sp.]|nr:disulfide bond formation protein B [Roseovarius sp.]